MLAAASKFDVGKFEGLGSGVGRKLRNSVSLGRGEGCGMVILKPLEQARRDNDQIRAIIVGSGINQDGKTPGITMPSGDAQGKIPNT